MSNIDKQALRNLALRATPGPWTMEHENIWYCENGYTKHLAYFCQGDDVDDSQDDANTRYVAAADPATVLALLDEVEAKEEQRANWFQMAQKLGEDLDGAEKRIAELESREVKLRDINDFIADVKEPTLANALSQLAKGVRAADISAIRRAGIRIAAASKGE